MQTDVQIQRMVRNDGRCTHYYLIVGSLNKGLRTFPSQRSDCNHNMLFPSRYLGRGWQHFTIKSRWIAENRMFAREVPMISHLYRIRSQLSDLFCLILVLKFPLWCLWLVKFPCLRCRGYWISELGGVGYLPELEANGSSARMAYVGTPALFPIE